MTVDELAAALGLSGNAIRPQLAMLERDGFVERAGVRRGASRPAQVYALSRDADLLFSHAYIPVLTELLHVLDSRLERGEFDAVMREVGGRLMAGRPRPTGNPRQRAEAASELLNSLGGLARVEQQNGALTHPKRRMPAGGSDPALPGGLQCDGEPAGRVHGTTGDQVLRP